MFDTHQNEIGLFARENSENMARVITFVFCTIQQYLYTTPDQMQDIDSSGTNSKWLNTQKSLAYDELQENKERLYNESMQIWREYPNPESARHELLKLFAECRGLGLIKAGFVCQLCFGISGCLDTHNLKRFNISETEFKASRYKGLRKELSKNRLIRKYHKMIDKSGGTKNLWNGWCNFVAENQQVRYANGHDVSKLHVTAILG